MKPLTIDGKSYRAVLCLQARGLRGHKFEVLFDADGERAYGALGGKDEPPAFYGSPERRRAGGAGQGAARLDRRRRASAKSE